MPVWHDAVKELRERGDLVVVGLVQEQHPERCALFQQWRQLDWPILWDPFNLSGAEVVPNFTTVDEEGMVQKRRARLPKAGEDFLARDFGPSAPDPPGVNTPKSKVHSPLYLAEVMDFLKAPAEERDHGALIEALRQAVADGPRDAAARFRLGVAYRLRFDSAARRPGDFQAAVHAWEAALAMRPGQYIWRRRIQQYGPRMDKPYPFYSWVEQAREELRARGETPVRLPVPLAAAERAEPRRDFAREDGEREPDPSGGVPRDAGFVGLEPTLVHDSSEGRRAARLYLGFQPDGEQGVSWDEEAGPLQVWLDPSSLPDGLELEQRLLVAEPAGEEAAGAARTLECELLVPLGVSSAVLRGYALYGICEDATGACRWLRQDFEVQLY